METIGNLAKSAHSRIDSAAQTKNTNQVFRFNPLARFLKILGCSISIGVRVTMMCPAGPSL